MCHERRVVVVRDDDAGDAFGAAVGVEGIVFALGVNISCSGRGEVLGLYLAPPHPAVARVLCALPRSC